MTTFALSDERARSRAIAAVGMAPIGYVVTLAEKKRSTEQNRRLHAMLRDIADQLDYNGFKLEPEDWKRLFAVAIFKELRIVPSLDNDSIVTLTPSTTRLTVRQMSDLIEYLFAYGARRDVRWTEPQYDLRAKLSEHMHGLREAAAKAYSLGDRQHGVARNSEELADQFRASVQEAFPGAREMA